MCTSDAVQGGFCDRSQLGRFIVDLPQEMSLNDTSFWSARVAFGGNQTSDSSVTVSKSGFWDNPNGNPPKENSEYASPFKPRNLPRRIFALQLTSRQETTPPNPSTSGILRYHDPIQYNVRKTGYYCVGMFPGFVKMFSF